MIKFHCSKCGKGVKAPDKYAGKRVKCPSCQTPNLLPADEDLEAYEVEEITCVAYEGVFCQHCGKKMKKAAVYCPGCGCENTLNKTVSSNTISDINTNNVVICYVLSILFPIGGIIGGIYLCCKGKAAHGIACILLSIFIGIPVGMGFMAAITP
jgi:hypothetical protein